MSATGEITAPALLLAMPQIQDPFFRQSVVLLLAHQDQGSFGFVVNRPSNLRVIEILEDLEIAWRGAPGALAYVGGPVQPQLGTVLVGSDQEPPAEVALETLTEVAPGIAITQSLEHLTRLAATPGVMMRLILGYAGWGEGQLAQEIGRHDWLVAPIDPILIFTEDPERAWRDALGSIGIDAGNLPSWIAASSEAN
jgi:putative transcriptional regulator